MGDKNTQFNHEDDLVNWIIGFIRRTRRRFFEIPRFKKDFLSFINKCNDGKDMTKEYCNMIIFLGRIQEDLPKSDYTSYLLTMHNMFQNKEEIKRSTEKEMEFARQEIASLF